jgi:Dyp-type peroxidase family
MVDIRDDRGEGLPNITVALSNDEYREQFTQLLSDTQGNILKGHGLGFAAHVMLRFNKDPRLVPEVLKWISEFNPTSALEQYERYAKTDDNVIDSGTDAEEAFRFLALTKAGYEALGISPKDQPQNATFQRPNPKYQRGMRYPLSSYEGTDGYGYDGSIYYPERDDTLGRGLESEYRGEIHAVVIIARNVEPDDEFVLREGWRTELGSITDRSATIVSTEFGYARWMHTHHGIHLGRKPVGDGWYPIEHFGFRDGISNPRFFQSRVPEKNSPNGGGKWRWNPFSPLSLVLTHSNGSYLVFRKLEQDVDKFEEKIAELADELFGGNTERALTMVMGRKPDGTPAIDANMPSDGNDFDYRTDPDGKLCPFHSHVRRTNPRGEIEDLGPKNDPRYSKDQERRWLIARRGVPYGNSSSDRVGLLFLSFQSDLGNFERIQHSADDENFTRVGGYGATVRASGMDPIIGQRQAPISQAWPSDASQQGVYVPERHLFHDVVTFRGGEYFYAPGVGELKSLWKISAHRKEAGILIE